jgi:hypothetical protein
VSQLDQLDTVSPMTVRQDQARASAPPGGPGRSAFLAAGPVWPAVVYGVVAVGTALLTRVIAPEP